MSSLYSWALTVAWGLLWSGLKETTGAWDSNSRDAAPPWPPSAWVTVRTYLEPAVPYPWQHCRSLGLSSEHHVVAQGWVGGGRPFCITSLAVASGRVISNLEGICLGGSSKRALEGCVGSTPMAPLSALGSTCCTLFGCFCWCLLLCQDPWASVQPRLWVRSPVRLPPAPQAVDSWWSPVLSCPAG